MKRVQILLSTYNGERYLREQLDSFLSQDIYADTSVLIRDDGSTDGTRAILEEYRDRHGFTVVFGENLGLNASMFTLFSLADKAFSYFAYADQDDVWLPDKLSRAVTVLDGMDAHTPALYSARSVLTDAALHPIGETRYPRRTPSFYNAMVQNVAPGHSQVFNRALLSLVCTPPPDGIYVVDQWLWLCATAFGQFYLDRAKTALYRQHGGNAIGYGEKPSRIFRSRVRQVMRDIPRAHARQVAAFLFYFGDSIPDAYRAEARRFLSHSYPLSRRLRYALSHKIFRQGAFDNLCLPFLYLLGRYQIKFPRNKQLSAPITRKGN